MSKIYGRGITQELIDGEHEVTTTSDGGTKRGLDVAIVSGGSSPPASQTVDQATHDLLNANANIQVGDVDVGPGNAVPVDVLSGGLSATDLLVTSVAVSTSASVTDLTITNATNQKLLVVQPLGTALCYWSFDTTGAVSASNGQIFSQSRPLVLNNINTPIRIGTGTAQTFLISKGT